MSRVGHLTKDQPIANKLKSVIYDFYIFFVDMFSLRICRYSIGKLMIEVLNMVGKCEIFKIEGPREARPPLEFDQKSCLESWDLTVLENFPGGRGVLGID